MPNHPALAAGRVAVITGAASGIGLAAARRFASLGLKVCLADLSAEALDTSQCAGSGGNWQTWLLFADVDRNGAFNAGDALVRQHVEVSNRMNVTSSAASVRFESTGIAHSDNGVAVVFVLGPKGASSESTGSDLALQRQVCVNPRGEVVVIAGGATCP